MDPKMFTLDEQLSLCGPHILVLLDHFVWWWNREAVGRDLDALRAHLRDVLLQPPGPPG